jgi:hypothetical protein
MSAHFGAPGLRRPQLATPASAPVAGATRASQGAHRQRPRRRALLVALGTLCAPALAASALAAIGATSGSGGGGMGTLAGSQGLRGSTAEATTPAPAPVAAKPKVRPVEKEKRAVVSRRRPAPSAPSTEKPPAEKPSSGVGRTPVDGLDATPVTRSPSYTTDPNAPGAPISSSGADSTTTSSSGTSADSSLDGTGSTSDAGSGGG